MSTVLQLPNEIIEAILLRLPPLSDSKESVRTLCRVGEASSRFLAISRLPHIWQPHFVVQWHRSDAVREEARKSSTGGDWWSMYVARARIDCRALDILEAIIARPDDREFLAVELTQDLGYDAWEAVSKVTSCVHFRKMMDTSIEGGYDVPIEGFTRRYWAQEILDVISRIRAINIWLPLSNPLTEDVSFEHGLAALSAFFGVDVDKIFEEFDRLAANCRDYLSSLGLSPSNNLTETAVQICAWMRQQGFVKADLTNYHNLLNHFPHRVLFENPVTLPLSLVYVFVCLARRLGLDARPVTFPNKVLAVVFPPTGQAVYVDVYESATRPILSYASDLPPMLHVMGLDPTTLARHAAPAPTGTVLLRAVNNILHSLDRITSWSEGNQVAAHYAAYCAAILLTRDVPLIRVLFVVNVGGPLGYPVVVKNALRPGLSMRAREELDLYLMKQSEGERSNPKSAGRDDVLHFIGVVFRHKKFQYVGLVKGWDYRCEAGDEWIRRMHVDELPQGRYQPFYHSLTQDSHYRYVAEENVEPISHPTVDDLRDLITSSKEIGRWFDGVEFTASGAARFTLSPESNMLYPGDDMAGRAFLANH